MRFLKELTMSLKVKVAKTAEPAEQNPTLTNTLGQIEKAFGKGTDRKSVV